MTDLDETLRSVLEHRPQGYSHRARGLGNIAICLHVRVKHLKRLSDFNEVLALRRSRLTLHNLKTKRRMCLPHVL